MNENSSWNLTHLVFYHPLDVLYCQLYIISNYVFFRQMLMLLRRIASLFSSQQLRRYHALHFRELPDCVSSKSLTTLFTAKTDYHFKLDFRYGIIVLFAVSMYYLCRYTLWINAYWYWYMNTSFFGRWMLCQMAFHINNVDALLWA